MGQSQGKVIGQIRLSANPSIIYEGQLGNIEKAVQRGDLSYEQKEGYAPCGEIKIDGVTKNLYCNIAKGVIIDILERDKNTLISNIATELQNKGVNSKLAIGVATKIADSVIPAIGRIGITAIGTAMVLIPGPQQSALTALSIPVVGVMTIIHNFVMKHEREIVNTIRENNGLAPINDSADNIDVGEATDNMTAARTELAGNVPASKWDRRVSKFGRVLNAFGGDDLPPSFSHDFVVGGSDLPPFFSHDFVVGGAYTDELRRMGGAGGTYVGIDAGDDSDAEALADISKYASSINAKTKDALVDTILRVLENLGLKAEGKTRMEKIASILKNIPSGDKFKSGEESHKRVCYKIAEAINDMHGSKIIDSNLPAEVVCRQIVEIISSLAAGMHTEFLTVYNEAKRVLSNLHILDSATDENMEQLKQKITATEDRELVDNLSLNYDLFKMLSEEKERQLTLMKNILNIDLASTEKDLADLLKKKKNLYKYVESVEYRPGKGEFGKVIEAVLKGLGLTAAYAELINNALKKIGMSMEEYANEKNLSEFQRKVTEKLSGAKLNDKDLHDFLAAADLLYKNFYRNTDIATFIKSRQGMYEQKLGGATRYPKSIVDKRVADKRKLRNLIFSTFYRSVSEIFSNMVGSLNIISKKIGTEIPLSDQLDEFRHIIQRMRDELVENKNVYYALIGYYNDALSKEKRETLLGELRMISSYVDTILEMELYRGSAQYFKDFQSAIKALIGLIEKYSEEMAAKFGRGEDGDEVNPAPKEHSIDVMEEGDCRYIKKLDEDGEALGEATGAYDGVDAEDVYGAAELFAEPVQMKRSSKTIYDAFRQFDYYYRVAQIRANLASTAGELKHYGGEKYERLVASSVANVLQDAKDKYDAFREYLERLDKSKIDGSIIPKDKFDEEKKSAIEFMDKQWEAKKKFWATMEAVDSYMRVFTDSLVNNPSDIRDIKSMLDDIEVINDTYNNATGERLANVFDHFPFRPLADNPVDVPLSDKGSEARHYYEKVKDVNGAVGNPDNVTTPVHGLMARNQIKAMITGMGMLKNFMSVFIYIGSKFGGNELRNKVFMTPTQIYNNIVDYIQASAFAQGVTSSAATDLTRDAAGKYVISNNYLQITPGSLLQGINTGSTSTGLGFAARFGVMMRSVNAAAADVEVLSFRKEDEYFVMLMKALAAKIFTVTGMYDVLDRPYEINSISPIRMIIGGVDLPKVEEGAVELYLRLPLLAQFYRDLFNFDGENDYNTDLTGIPREGNTHLKISMVPEVEGVFSGLINLVFKRTKNVYETAYTDEEMKELVSEINIIYQRMLAKHSQNVVMGTIRDFVDEINRRYAIVSKKDHDTYVKEFGYDYSYGQDSTSANEYDRYSEPIDTDIAILPGEDTNEIARQSPAERLLSMKFDKKDPLGKHTMDDGYYKLLYRFRCCIDKMFEESGAGEEYTFKNAIKIAQAKLKKEQKDDDRFKIVSSLVRGVDVYTKIDGFKYLLFHETVVAGLNTLSGIHSILQRFHDMCLVLDLRGHQEVIIEWLKGAGEKRFGSAFVKVYLNLLEKRLQMPKSTLEELVRNIFGRYEAAGEYGGHKGNLVDAEFKLKLINGVNDPDVSKKTGSVYSINYDGDCNSKFYQRNRLRTGDILLSANNDPKADPSTGKKGGLVEILSGFSVRDLEDALCSENDSDAKAAIQTFFRFLFGRETIMHMLVETVFGVTNDLQGLVDVRVDEGRLHFNLGGIKKYVEEMFGQVSYFVNALRPFIRPDLMDKYTSKINPGSYYWLHEQIMEKLIIGRPRQLKTEDIDKPAVQYINIEDAARKLSHCYEILTLQYLSDGSGLRSASPSTFKKASANSTSYDKVFSCLIFYNSALPGSGLLVSDEAPDHDPNGEAISKPIVADFRSNPYEQLLVNQSGLNKIVDTRYIARFKQLYSWGDELTLNRSAMYVFNQLVAKYIKQFYDPATQKIYINAINSFANGAFNQSIIDQLYTYPDVAPSFFVKYGKDGDYKTSGILFIKNKLKGVDDSLIKALSDAMSAAKNLTTTNTGPSIYTLDPIELKYLSKTNKKKVDMGGASLNQYTAHILMRLLANLMEKACNAAKSLSSSDLEKAYKDAPTENVSNINSLLQILITQGPINENVTTQSLLDIVNRLGLQDPKKYLGSIDINKLPETLDEIVAMPTNSVAVRAGTAAPSLVKASTHSNLVKQNVPGADEVALLTAIALHSKDWDLIEALSIFSPDDENAPPILTSDQVTIAAILTLYGLYNTAKGEPIELSNIKDELYKTHSYYKPRDKSEPTYSMKLDDSFSVVTDAIAESPIVTEGQGSGYLRFARSGPDDILPNDSYKKLDVNPNPGNGLLTTNISDIVRYGRRMDPDGMHVLFTSLSVVLKNIISSKNQLNQSVYLNEAISDVPLYMKERYRGEMPLFRMLFKGLAARCDLIRRFISRPELSLERKWDMVASGEPKANPWPFVLLKADIDSKTAKTRFNGILDTITKGCTAMISACDQVLREVGDDPKYLETYSGSIRDYKNQYGVDPFMPLSSALAIFRNKSRETYLDNLPFFVLGQDQFKFQFGTRMLFAQPQVAPTMEHVPGYAQIIESYNSLLDTRSHVDTKHAEDFMKAIIRGLRFVFELKHIKSNLVPVCYTLNKEYNHGFPKAGYKPSIWSDDLVIDQQQKDNYSPRDKSIGGPRDNPEDALRKLYYSVTNNPFLPITLFDFGEEDLNADHKEWSCRRLLPVYSITHDLSTVISMSESSLRDDKIREIVEYISQSERKKGSLAIKNIIDLNIIPINVHALMREVPLANVFNYAYTFDRLIIELFYGVNNVNARKLISELCYDVWGEKGPVSGIKEIYSVKDMLVSLLIRPYMKIEGQQHQLVDGMFRGVSGNELGRPKFLSDQLYNKALFGELYASTAHYSEEGPVASSIAVPIVSRNKDIQFGADVATKILYDMSLNNKDVFGVTLKGNLLHVGNVAKFLSDLIGYIMNHPEKTITDIYVNNKERAIKPGTGVDSFLDRGGASYDYFNLQASIVCKFVVYMLKNHSNYIKKTNAATYVEGLYNALQRSTVNVVGSNTEYTINPTGISIIKDFVTSISPFTLPGTGVGIVTSDGVLTTPFIDGKININLVKSEDLDSSLHYLDTVESKDYSKYGSVIEPDNENVLDSKQIHDVELSNRIAKNLSIIATKRLDTVFTRNLIFIVNLYRSVRMKLQRDLVYDRETVVRSAAITRSSLTEFAGNSVDTPKRKYSRDEHVSKSSPYIHRYERYNY